MNQISIHRIQGSAQRSPLVGERVRTRGVVLGSSRKGFFLQDPDGGDASCSCGIFVFARRDRPKTGSLVDVEGEVFEYVASENDKPITQLLLKKLRVISPSGPPIEPVWIDAAFLDVDEATLAAQLNRLEGMLVGLPAASVFIAPSNPFGDYVVLPPDLDVPRTPAGGVLIDAERPLRWFPSFRIVDYDLAPRVDVGTVLEEPVIGPLNYRVHSYQVAARGPLKIHAKVAVHSVARLQSDEEGLTVMTLNGFNLDPHVEHPSRVKDPRLDIDDDVGDGRYRMLAEAIVRAAKAPDVIALQEIQDDDGAEITSVVTAQKNFETIITAIRGAGGPRYRALDIPPVSGEDGGQPGGNIRNAYLYRDDRVVADEAAVRRIGDGHEAFDGSRKPLVAVFARKASPDAKLTVINVHLASKRHQYGIFAQADPGMDPREEVRIAQAQFIHEELQRLDTDVYVTGDFNDYEFSLSVGALRGEEYVNLVSTLDSDDRYDYNHRGVSQALMHGIVRRDQLDGQRADYEILHGNELTGSTPGHLGDRPTDHAYVIARLRPKGR